MKRCAGITLIETMLAMTISSFLLLGMITVFTQTRSEYRAAERVARTHENLRFAKSILQSDIRLANFWGRTRGIENLSVSPHVRVTCRKRDVTRWALDLSRAVETNDEVYELPCPGTRPSEKSDVLISRHAGTTISAATPGRVQIRSDGRGGTIFSNPAGLANPQPGAAIFDISINAYYVSDRSDYDENVPALRRLSLVRGVMQDQEIIPGISNLQVQLGLDTDGDGHTNTYIEGNDLSPAGPGDPVVAVRLQLTAHSPDPDVRPAAVTQTVYLRNAQRTAISSEAT